EARKNLKTPPTTNPEAYDYFLKAGNLTFFDGGLGGNRPNTKTAINLLIKAIALDSLFGDAYALLAINYGYLSFDAKNPGQWLDSAEKLAVKSIDLNPSREKGYVAMAMIKDWKNQKGESLKWLMKANDIVPNATAGTIAEYYAGINEYAK